MHNIKISKKLKEEAVSQIKKIKAESPEYCSYCESCHCGDNYKKHLAAGFINQYNKDLDDIVQAEVLAKIEWIVGFFKLSKEDFE